MAEECGCEREKKCWLGQRWEDGHEPQFQISLGAFAHTESLNIGLKGVN